MRAGCGCRAWPRRREKTLTAEARSVYTAYARGVNYYLETHRGRLPLEFTLLNYQPRPWRVRDTILAGLHMYRTLTTSWEGEIRKQHMLDKGDAQKVGFLFPARTADERRSVIERVGYIGSAHGQR